MSGRVGKAVQRSRTELPVVWKIPGTTHMDHGWPEFQDPRVAQVFWSEYTEDELRQLYNAYGTIALREAYVLKRDARVSQKQKTWAMVSFSPLGLRRRGLVLVGGRLVRVIVWYVRILG